MAINNNKQSYLEKKGIEARKEQTIRSDYNINDGYSAEHEDAISNPTDKNKVMGKGTGNGGHQHYRPNHELPSTLINYGNLDTTAGGGAYDIHGKNEVGGRKRLMTYNLYNSDNAYGPDSIDMSLNIDEGQYVIKG